MPRQASTRLTVAQAKLAADCIDFVLAGEWPFESVAGRLRSDDQVNDERARKDGAG